MARPDARYYRGYSLIFREGEWRIYWGDYLGGAPTLEEAEAIVDGWLDAK